MFRMKDIIRLPQDLGRAIREARLAGRMRATTIAERSGRSRNVLYRLERGEDVTVASLLDILRAMGFTLRLERLGMPTLEEVQQRFMADDDDDEEAGDAA
jgi:transcriptional regulator with XRE-family HTH domain